MKWGWGWGDWLFCSSIVESFRVSLLVVSFCVDIYRNVVYHLVLEIWIWRSFSRSLSLCHFRSSRDSSCSPRWHFSFLRGSDHTTAVPLFMSWLWQWLLTVNCIFGTMTGYVGTLGHTVLDFSVKKTTHCQYHYEGMRSTCIFLDWASNVWALMEWESKYWRHRLNKGVY